MPDEFSNGLTKGEAERLALLAEEAGEVVVACMKILRHGYSSSHPDAGIMDHNRADLEKELGHVENAMSLMIHKGDINIAAVLRAKKAKSETIAPWLHHQ